MLRRKRAGRDEPFDFQGDLLVNALAHFG